MTTVIHLVKMDLNGLIFCLDALFLEPGNSGLRKPLLSDFHLGRRKIKKYFVN